ncbi:MAG: tetratricopeptide repeat protein, partial [Actinomycetes bacterium]
SKIFEHVYQQRRLSLGPDHPQTGMSLIFLARVLCQTGRYVESQQKYFSGTKNLSSWIDHDSKFMAMLVSENDKVCLHLERFTGLIFSERNSSIEDLSAITLIGDLKNLLNFTSDKSNSSDENVDIEKLSTSYLRDQLEVLDIGLFELSVLKSFNIKKV